MNIFSNLILWDQQTALAVFSLRSEFWDKFFLLFTKIGGWQVIFSLLIILSIFLYWKKRKVFILPFWIAVCGSALLAVIVKYLVNRARPSADIALYAEKLPSFPSAHSALTLALFGFLIYLVWRFRSKMSLKIIFTIILASIILLIGFSRLYLGVHYLTDVLAGYLVGLLWLLVAMYVSRRISFSSSPQLRRG